LSILYVNLINRDRLDSYPPTLYNETSTNPFGGKTMPEMSEKHHEQDPHMVEVREHMKAARQAMHQSFESLMPTGYLEKRRAARKEFLLAMRSMVDAAIARLEKRADQ
jgi:hypothetical protein